MNGTGAEYREFNLYYFNEGRQNYKLNASKTCPSKEEKQERIHLNAIVDMTVIAENWKNDVNHGILNCDSRVDRNKSAILTHNEERRRKANRWREGRETKVDWWQSTKIVFSRQKLMSQFRQKQFLLPPWHHPSPDSSPTLTFLSTNQI